MENLKVLWVDLRLVQNQVGAYRYLSEDWAVSYISNADRIDQEIREGTPALLCFEYDYPDISSLLALRQARCLFPSTPLIMLTEQHSEALAIWALRLRVWDYFVKPFQPQELMTSAANILTQQVLPSDEIAQPGQKSNYSSNPIPVDIRVGHWQKKKTYAAEAFVENHYHEKVYEEEVAQCCGMSTSTFSRSFRKEHQMTFRDYLINYRISKAQELLKNSNVLVTDVAYTVGYHDPSYFTRTFRRIVGMSPSRYHEAHKIH